MDFQYFEHLRNKVQNVFTLFLKVKTGKGYKLRLELISISHKHKKGDKRIQFMLKYYKIGKPEQR